MDTTETRRVGNHFFIFEKGRPNANEKSRTLIAPCVSKNDEKLPREFVNYMRSLFDILDEGRRGFVKLSDIEALWGRKNANLGAQPSAGILESLRRVAPPNGLLSFERLCLGFQLALRPTGEKFQEAKQSTIIESVNGKRCEVSEEGESCLQITKDGQKTRADDQTLVRNRCQRPRSMVQQDQLDLSVAKRKGGILEGIQSTDKATVIDKLRQWHQEESHKANNGVKEKARTEANSYSKGEKTAYSRRQMVKQPATGNESDYEHRQSKQHSRNKKSHLWLPKARVYYQGQKPNSGLKGGSRDAGIHDSGAIISKDAKLKNLEEELKVFGDGLRAVEEVRDWLFARITVIQEEKLYVERVNKYSPQDNEAVGYSSRRRELGLNAPNFRTIASHIEELKLQLHQILQKPLTSSLLKTPESDSKQRIAQLEKEKNALIRELFQYQSQQERARVFSM